jgi:predicted ABC-type ATPase
MDLYIIAGPNGAGKTTFAREFLPRYAESTNFVNADLIARGISPFAPDAAAVRAGKLFLGQIHFLAKQRVPFCVRDNIIGQKLFEPDSAASACRIRGSHFLFVG